jgi:hypothetical protein
MSFEVLYIRSKQLLRLYFHSGMRRSYISQSLVLTLSPRLASPHLSWTHNHLLVALMLLWLNLSNDLPAGVHRAA